MFGRKKGKNPEPDYPDSRFCLRASELPLYRLYGADRFVVALSQIKRPQSWFESGSTDEVKAPLEATGLLHGSIGDEPLLPVRVTVMRTSDVDLRFRPDPKPGGCADLWGGPRNPPTSPTIFSLNVNIYDADGRMSDALTRVMHQAAVSKADFVHLECVRTSWEEPLEWGVDQIEQRQREVEAGERTLERIVFDRVNFEERIELNAPTWSWAWNDPGLGDLKKPGFRSKATAEWRRWNEDWLAKQERTGDG